MTEPRPSATTENVQLLADIALIAESDLFDRAWYLAQYPDAAETGLDPVRHYLLIGTHQGKNPSADFDTNGYLTAYPDVAKAGMNPLRHYLLAGASEGRTRGKKSPETNRDEYLRTLFNTAGYGLEIGPAHHPIICKASGAKVEIVDRLDADGLRNKYRDVKDVDINRIEEVDYVLDGRSIAEIVGKIHFYDYIVASHVIEHVPDLLGLLKDCQTLLKPDGVLVLVVPDKRYCFDVFQPLSSTGMILQAHAEQQCRPSPGSLFDSYAYRAERMSGCAWSRHADPSDSLSFAHPLDLAMEKFDEAIQSQLYEDGHIWRFVPSSFRLVINDLYETGHIAIKEKDFYDTVGCEFYITLAANAGGCPIDRLTLASRAQQELAHIVC